MYIKNALRTVLFLSLAALALASCAPKPAGGNAQTAAPTLSIGDIKDVAGWTAAYQKILEEYADVSAKLNAGNSSLLSRSTELVEAAARLDSLAETLKGTLSGDALSAFTAKIAEFRSAFEAASKN